MNKLPGYCMVYSAICIVFFGGQQGFSRETQGSGAEFALDANTLLLAHFNASAYDADYANGVPRFSGSGALLTEGYYGKAVDLRLLQFVKDFEAAAESPLACFYGFALRPYGNVNLQQGTYETWFKFGAESAGVDRRGSLLHNAGRPHVGRLLSSALTRQVRKPGDAWFKDLTLAVTPEYLSFCFPFLPYDYEEGKIVFRSVPGGQNLGTEDWHHLALCWSEGEFAGYLDGRLFFSTDMTERRGFAVACNVGIGVVMSGLILDELRVSDVARYHGSFEPHWRDGQRPGYAFPGVPDIKRYPAKLKKPVRATALADDPEGEFLEKTIGAAHFAFDRKNGRLHGFGFGGKTARRGVNGLLLWEGLDHRRVAAAEATDWRTDGERIGYVQQFDNGIRATHAIREEGGAIRWSVALFNGSQDEKWVEPVLSVPLPFDGVTEFFDGCWVQKSLAFSRRRDEYIATMPFAAAAGKELAVGVGLDPHAPYSALVTEWIPEGTSGTIRQGTKIALAPGERHRYEFVLFSAPAHFGALNALERYHDLSPDLYRLRPDVPVYSYLPVSGSVFQRGFPDFDRLAYVGSFWGHGPGHSKGDEYGVPRWWDNTNYYGEKSYEYTMKIELQYGSIADVRRFIALAPRVEFDNFYPVRRFHYCPDVTAEFIVKDLWPEYDPQGDPLVRDQYYYPLVAWWMINEYNTPIGQHFKETARRYWREAAPYLVGFINDMSDLTLIRHADPIAKKTPGRAFSADKGTYVLGHCGRWDRYRTINSFVDDGHRASIWSDGGFCSYIACGYSSSQASEFAGEHYGFMTGADPLFTTTRHMAGEKPVCGLLPVWSDEIARYFKPEEFTPEQLRAYYRYRDAHLFLKGVKLGHTLVPYQLFGRLELLERYPILIESTVLGRQTHPGGYVAEPLWMVRAGRGLDSLLVVGNEKPRAQATDIRVVNRYFGGIPLFGPYFGGELSETFSDEAAVIEKTAVGARNAAGFKCLGRLAGGAEGAAAISFAGDGLSIRVKIELDLKRAADLMLNTFAPMYEVERVAVNGSQAAYAAGENIPLPRGRTAVTAEYRHRSLDFTAADWKKVDLIKAGQTDFRIVADAGATTEIYKYSVPLGFERGTAMLLNYFLRQYDEEDGVVGNLGDAPILPEKPAAFDGWTLILKNDSLAGAGKARIDSGAKEIVFTGRNPGEVRRAMVAFLRLLDRKYPHVGRLLPLQDLAAPHMQPKYKYEFRPWPVDDPLKHWLEDDNSKTFFGNFRDKTFLVKPVLGPEHENLYKDGNLNFAGKYALRFSPHLFEPTWADDFVHGYAGPAAVETDEELNRPVRRDRQELLKELKRKE